MEEYGEYSKSGMRKRSARVTETPQSSSESSDSDIQPQLKRRKEHVIASETSSTDIHWLVQRTAVSGNRNQSARVRKDSEGSSSESSSSDFQPQFKRRKKHVIASETSSTDIHWPVQRTAVSGKRNRSARLTEGCEGTNSESSKSDIQPELKRRKTHAIASESTSTDMDWSVQRTAVSGNRNQSARVRKYSEGSSSESSDSDFQPQFKRGKTHAISSETNGTDIDFPVQRTAVSGKRNQSALVTEDSESSISESSKSGIQPELKRRKFHAIASKSSSTDMDWSVQRTAVNGKRNQSARVREDSEGSSSESSDSDFQRQLKRRETRAIASESSSTDMDWPRHTPDAGVQRIFVDDDEGGFDSKPEAHDDAHFGDDKGDEVSGEPSVEHASNEGNKDSFEENLMKTEGETEELCPSSQPGALSETEDAFTEAASLPSTFSQAVPHKSDGSNDEQPAECYICLEEFITQEVGTPDVCNHSFCVTCLQGWSKRANTCPIDRQEFNFIHVRIHLKGEIVRSIAVEPETQVSGDEDDDLEDIICEVCGESDREYDMLLCDFCGVLYHIECLDPVMYTLLLGYWLCPNCTWFNEL
jgi:hypothetical protein